MTQIQTSGEWRNEVQLLDSSPDLHLLPGLGISPSSSYLFNSSILIWNYHHHLTITTRFGGPKPPSEKLPVSIANCTSIPSGVSLQILNILKLWKKTDVSKNHETISRKPFASNEQHYTTRREWTRGKNILLSVQVLSSLYRCLVALSTITITDFSSNY